jgi:hypothetical protein
MQRIAIAAIDVRRAPVSFARTLIGSTCRRFLEQSSTIDHVPPLPVKPCVVASPIWQRIVTGDSQYFTRFLSQQLKTKCLRTPKNAITMEEKKGGSTKNSGLAKRMPKVLFAQAISA